MNEFKIVEHSKKEELVKDMTDLTKEGWICNYEIQYHPDKGYFILMWRIDELINETLNLFPVLLNNVEQIQRLSSVYILPKSLISEKDFIHQVLGIVDDQEFVKAIRAYKKIRYPENPKYKD